ncbi:ComEA family DNA-binding protein [Legionella maioricensis]|uniref:Helix-hairpin-helix domain-containing protein n=1 Tax=Legionella maioricensis TaxID=2896528 RepID=A0A9X2I9S8_9GAMM|nr:helix-hairpin-helix domain-containing protein [Legionella maioricensis]MCL9683509.1 helix-hairpin-helix domain-containing protein [Legionella maioricensis]MCL9686808.1 helix-hairpin-helix domain-containing protein [Legionella maioricensis]
MKAKYIAMCLSLFAITLPVYAVSSEITPSVKQTTVVRNKIDLNKADLSILTGSFKGIGKKRAEAIIAYRENHHGFKAIEELAEVKGFGQRFIEINREKLKEVFIIN